MNPLQTGTQVGQQRVITVAVAAPGDVVPHRFGIHPGAGDGLIAAVQHLFAAPLRHVHFALHHGNARAFHTGADAEDGPGHRYAAIAGIYKQVAFMAFGGFHHHAAAAQPNRQIIGGSGSEETRPLAQFQRRSVGQAQQGIGILGRTNLHALRQVLSGGQRAEYAIGRHLIQHAADRFHSGPAAGRARAIDHSPDTDSGRNHHHRRGRPASRVRVPPGRPRHRTRRRHSHHFSFVDVPAGDARMQVILHQHGAPLRQTPRAVIGEQRLKASAAADGLAAQLAGRFRQPRPHAVRGSLDHRRIDRLVANFRQCLFQSRVLEAVFRYHASPPW